MDKDKVIKEFEKSAGFRVCYWCNKSIGRANRILFSEEYENKKDINRMIKVKVIGACCKECFNEYSKKCQKESVSELGGKHE